ncbi:MAG: DNA topoisomerase 3 [Candidatus Latescibacterota bacterium]
MKTVVLAEKPSVARDVARVLGARLRREGYLEGEGCVVTWALGHLVQFAEPDDYGPEWKGRWSFGQLPIVPSSWKLKTEGRTAAQFRVVRQLLNAADTGEVIAATDAGREGENIFRLIYEHAGCRKPFRRLWVSSLTDEAIRDGLAHLQAGEAFDDLAAAARARTQADWLVGMNLTRAYTVHNGVLCTIGRVQTPTLAMLVSREREIAAFRKTTYYELRATLQEGFTARYARDGQTRIEGREEADELLRQLAPFPTGTVARVEKSERRLRPPPFYSLVDLQRDANRRLGLTAAQVLQQAQALYETHKLITYPRTESRHLSEDMVPRLPQILAQLEHPLAAAARERLQQGHRLGRFHVDRTKLTDHHAIVPTGVAPPPSLPPPTRRVYDLVAARFVAAFLPDHVLEDTEVDLQIGPAQFAARGSVVLQEGWKAAEGPGGPRRREAQVPGDATRAPGAEADAAASGEPEQVLPPLVEGQVVHVERLEVLERETQPPRRYTDATLLSAMKNAGRQLDDEALAEAMKESGLGTPATRAEIIERLIRTGYVARERRSLVPTPKGMALVQVVAEPLRNPELTARWEQQLKEIEEGRFPAASFYAAIVRFVEELVPAVQQGPVLPPESRQAGPAGDGGKGRRDRGRRGAGQGGSRSPGRGRGRSLATAGAGGQTSEDPLAASAAGEETGGAPDGGAVPAGLAPDLGPCPACRLGTIVENRKAYGCSRFREGCRFTIWKEVAGKRLSLGQVKELLQRGRTAWLEGFRSRAGKPFAAALRLNGEFRVELDFGGAEGESRPRPPAQSTLGPAESRPRPRQGRKASRTGAVRTPRGAGRPESGVLADTAVTGPPTPPTTVAASAAPYGLAESPAAHPEVGASAPAGPVGLTCPRCLQGTILEGRRGFGCSRYREGCTFVVWKETAGKALTARQVCALIEKGKTPLIKGFRDEAGTPFAARLYLGPQWTVVVDRQGGAG